MTGHTTHMRRALALGAAMCKAQYLCEKPTPTDFARLFCALQLGAQGFPPDLAWTWTEAEVNERILTSIELRPPSRAIAAEAA